MTSVASCLESHSGPCGFSSEVPREVGGFRAEISQEFSRVLEGDGKNLEHLKTQECRAALVTAKHIAADSLGASV